MALLEEVREKYGLNGEVLSVTGFRKKIEEILRSKPEFKQVHVLGEVSDLATPPSGHCYFSLTDGEATVACTYFKHNHNGFKLEEGLQVLVAGELTVHPTRSQFQVNVRQVYPVGEGIESLKLKQLKEKLAREGLFDAKRKKALPEHPNTVGLVVAQGSEAERDVCETLRQNAPGISVVCAYARVTGRDAAESLVLALKELNRRRVDVIVVARGGGPKEDFSAFNDEAVVRAVASSQVPVVTGIGHESDVCLADFAADKSAITPTAAAKEVSGDALARAKAEKEREQAGYYTAKTFALAMLALVLIALLIFLILKIIHG